MSAKSTVKGKWGALIRKYESLKACAEALNVKPVQLWRWGTAVNAPELSMQRKINRLAIKHKVAMLYPRAGLKAER